MMYTRNQQLVINGFRRITLWSTMRRTSKKQKRREDNDAEKDVPHSRGGSGRGQGRKKAATAFIRG